MVHVDIAGDATWVAALVSVACIVPGALASDTSLISISASGTGNPSSASTLDASVSDDGRFVVFRSDSGSLLPGGSTALTKFHIFLRDRLLQQTIQVSPAQIATEHYQHPGISADGSTVVFETENAVLSSDVNDVMDVYVFDVASQAIECMSVDPSGIPKGGTIFSGSLGQSQGALSADGKLVAFHSSAVLDPADTNTGFDVYVRDRSSQTTRLESVTASGTSGNGASTTGVLSATGEYLLFSTKATDLAASPSPGVYRKNRITGAMLRVDLDSAGSGFTGTIVQNYALSGDGEHVVLAVSGKNPAFGDESSYGDIFVNDLTSQTISRVSIATNGGAINGHCREPDISFDGRYVSFVCEGTNAVVNDQTGGGFIGGDVILLDRATRQSVLVSVSDTLAQGELASGSQAAVDQSMSSDGSRFAILTYQQLEPAVDTMISTDVYLRERLGFASFPAGKPGGTGIITLMGTGSTSVGGSGSIAVGNAAPNSIGFLFVGLDNVVNKPLSGPIAGATLVTIAPLWVQSITTSGTGQAVLPYSIPDALFAPAIYFQAFVADPGVSGGVAVSEGLQMAF